MLIGGIDPGLHGGIAFINGSDVPIIHDMPVVMEKSGKKSISTRVDEMELIDILLGNERKPYLVAIEKASPFPKQGGVSNFSIGYQFGLLKGILSALAIPYEIIPPKQWQKHFFGGMGDDTKYNSYQAASRLFPMAELRTKRGKILDGRSDALLIAEFARRRVS